MKKQFFVLVWDANTDSLKHYDVLPYLREVYKRRKEVWKTTRKSKEFQKTLKEDPLNLKYYKIPKTYNEFMEFVDSESHYMFRARCEWEMICHGWPIQKQDYKLNVYEQIKMNLDTIAKFLYDEYGSKNHSSSR